MSPMKFLQVTYSKSGPNQGVKVNRMNRQTEVFLFGQAEDWNSQKKGDGTG